MVFSVALFVSFSKYCIFCRKGKRIEMIPQMKNRKSYCTFFFSDEDQCLVWFMQQTKLQSEADILIPKNIWICFSLPSSSFALSELQWIWKNTELTDMVYYCEEPGPICPRYRFKKHPNLLLSTADKAKSSRTSLHRFCLTSSNCFWEEAKMQRFKSNCKSKRLASHEILTGDGKD